MLEYNLKLFVKINPPSPYPPKILVGQNEKQPKEPKVPTNLLLNLAPCDCAQSSIIDNLYLFERDGFLLKKNSRNSINILSDFILTKSAVANNQI